MTPDERKKLNEVYDFIQSLKRYSEIPLDVEQSFFRRLGLANVPTLASSSVTVASFTQAVNEAGAGSYNVAKRMTGFITIYDGSGTGHTVATYD